MDNYELLDAENERLFRSVIAKILLNDVAQRIAKPKLILLGGAAGLWQNSLSCAGRRKRSRGIGKANAHRCRLTTRESSQMEGGNSDGRRYGCSENALGCTQMGP